MNIMFDDLFNWLIAGFIAIGIVIIFGVVKLAEFFIDRDTVIKTSKRPVINWELKVGSDKKTTDTIWVYTFKQ